MGCEKKQQKGKLIKKGKLYSGADRLNLFHLGDLRDFITFYRMMEKESLSIEDVENFIKRKQHHDAQITERAWDKIKWAMDLLSEIPNCPDCGSYLEWLPVNTNPANVIGGDYKTLFQCRNHFKCGYEFASELTPEEYYDKIKSDKILKGA